MAYGTEGWMAFTDAELLAMEMDLIGTERLFRRGRAYMGALALGHLALAAWWVAGILPA